MKNFLLCGALLVIATPAAAAGLLPVNENPEFQQTTVSYADLDLSRPAGAKVMVARLRRAARAVCDDGLFSDHTRLRRIRVCVRSAMTGALEQLDAPLVTARYLKTLPRAELASR